MYTRFLERRQKMLKMKMLEIGYVPSFLFRIIIINLGSMPIEV